MKLAALHLYVHQIDRAQEFYERRLGLPLKADAHERGCCSFTLGAADLVLEAVAPDAPEDEQSLVGRRSGITFAVDDIQAHQLLLAARGVPFHGPPERRAAGGWQTRFEDPDGNELQLVQHAG